MAENLWLNTYRMMDTGKGHLKKCGFRWHSAVTGQNTSNYIYTFPLVKYKKYPCVVCEIVVTRNTGEVICNVYDSSHNLYFPFYTDFFLYRKRKERMNQRIKKEFKRLGILQV